MIREMKPEDRATYLQMAHAFYNSEAVLHAVPEAVFVKSFEEMMKEGPYIRGYIIEDQGRPAGYMILSFTFSAEVGGLVVLVEEIYLDEGCRGKGLGSQALEFARQSFLQAARLRLEVTEENQAAVRLYLRRGYKPLEYKQMVIDLTGAE